MVSTLDRLRGKSNQDFLEKKLRSVGCFGLFFRLGSGSFDLVVVGAHFAQTVLKRSDAFTKASAQLRQLFTAKEYESHQQNDNQMRG
jgi:hypothetical protein